MKYSSLDGLRFVYDTYVIVVVENSDLTRSYFITMPPTTYISSGL